VTNLSHNEIKSLTISKPDDWHLHLRDGGAMRDVVKASASCFGRAIIMPNLSPPVTKVFEAQAYYQRIMQAVDTDFQASPVTAPTGDEFTIPLATPFG